MKFDINRNTKGKIYDIHKRLLFSNEYIYGKAFSTSYMKIYNLYKSYKTQKRIKGELLI